jgi:imidazolonepropionase-like amidohydrolase
VNFRYLEAVPLTLMTARAARLMLAMLNRGFTTVRDTGGADWGMKTAVDRRDIPGPRLFIAGARDRADRGHSDRAAAPIRAALPLLHAMRFGMRSRTAFRGAKSVTRADAPGRDHIKIMMSGAASSLRSARQPAVQPAKAAACRSACLRRYVCAQPTLGAMQRAGMAACARSSMAT